jgi:crotonobetainyl-CoA:carnitine CoA-transferase CaiB-like acyl-CoA transferase
MAPLTGLRVLDLSNVLAGPFCCHQLAHLGADVIKVEVPGRGDLARQLGADSELNQKFMGVSFLAQNAGKRSVTLNLKSPKGIALLKKLLLSADVLVENFRPGVMERLGIGWEVLREINPRLVYCAISGFGQDGPWRDLPAYDQIIQGASGVMSITGDADTAPYRVGYPISDTIGGLTAAFAITAALQGRSAGGGGSFIDVSMLEATMATMGWVLSNWLIAGQRPSANGNENFTSAPSGTFRTADAPLNIAANKQEQWEILCRHLGREELLQHPDYVTREARKVNRQALKAELEKTLTGRPASDWADELNRLGVPAGTVMEVPDILAHPQIADRGMIAGFDDVPGVGRGIRVARTGIKLDGEAPSVQTPPPRLGEHNADIYGQLGLTAGEIADLQKEKII